MVSMGKEKRPANPAMLQRCPEYRDPRALLEHEIAAIARVSQCEDLALALKAGQWLVEYGESLRKSEHQGKRKRRLGNHRAGAGHGGSADSRWFG
jgi:hypothetical protein